MSKAEKSAQKIESLAIMLQIEECDVTRDVLDKSCGTECPQPQYLTGPIAKIEFLADYASRYRGFKATLLGMLTPSSPHRILMHA